MSMTKHCQWVPLSLCSPYSLQFLGWGPRARLATDWVPSCSLHHVCWMCTWQQLMYRARGVLGWVSSFQIPSRMTFPFPVLLISPLKGFEVWVSLMFSSVHAKASPGDDWTSEACANGVLSQSGCQAVVFCCLFDVYLAWCLVCPTQCLACDKSSLPLACVETYMEDISGTPPYPSQEYFLFSRSTSFHLPSTTQTHLLDMRKFPYTEVKKKKDKPRRDKNMFL